MTQADWIVLLSENGILKEGLNWRFFTNSSLKNEAVDFEGIGIGLSHSGYDVKNISERLIHVFTDTSLVKLVRQDGLVKPITLRGLSSYLLESPIAVVWGPSSMERKSAQPASFAELAETMKILREEGGCPWDRAQDHVTLRTYFIQEVYEVIDAIDHGDYDNLKEELGDVLYQIAFHARIEEEKGNFNLQDVINGINDKMRRRHPFVFDAKVVKSADIGEESWENRKKIEKNRKYLLSGIPKSLPSLLLACIIQKKVSSTTVKLPMESYFSVDDAWRNAIKVVETGDRTEKEEKCGAFLFELVRVLREAGIDPELSLHRFCIDYMQKFNSLEDTLR